MFRKKRAASNPPVPPAAAPSAASAAAVAFLNKRASDASLSASAAAAALRSHTTSPEPIGAIQTKRMIRRGSFSSYGGSPSGSTRQPFSSTSQRPASVAAIQRPASATPMRERSFRSQSPAGRRAQALPTVPDDVPPIPVKSHRRTPSMESSATSPLPANASRNGNGGPVATTVKWDPHTRTVVRVPVQNRLQSGNPGSPRSVNFSRPMSPPLTHNTTPREPVRARPATAQGFRAADTQRSQPPMPSPSQMAAILSQQARSAQTAAASPAAGPKGPTAPRPVSSVAMSPGALVAASTAARPASVTSSPISPTTFKPPVTKSAAIQTRSVSGPMAPVSEASLAAPATQARAKTPTVVANQPTRPAMTKGPSEDEIKAFQLRAASMLARPLADTAAIAPSGAGQAKAVPTGSAAPKPAQPPVGQISEVAPSTERPASLSVASAGVARAPSQSPTRSARFSQTPVIENIKHQPPSRDLSPAKSALKGTSSRTTSPMRPTSDENVETDDGLTSEQQKRKSAKVSFDEKPVVVGEATTPMTPASDSLVSPQYAKASTDPFDGEDDQEYTPRPALPSFGSVRGGRSPSRKEDSASAPAETSSDQVVGGIIAQDFATRGTGVSSELAKDENANEATAGDVPSIAVLPATPRVDQENKTLTSPEQVDASQPSAEASRALESQPQGEAVPGIASVGSTQFSDVESEENAEHFADAAEDHTGSEGEAGFASLDAIIESPAAEVPPTIPLSPSANGETAAVRDINGTAITTSEPATTTATASADNEDWDRIRKYWSSLSEQRKQELEREAAKNVSTSEFASAFAPINESIDPGAGKSGVTAAAGQARLPPWPDRQYQESAKNATPPMKQTMRASHQRGASEPSHWRTSLRDGNRPSSAVIEPRSKPLSSPRPQSAVVATPVPASSASAAAAASPNIAAKKAAKPALQRTLSNESSASESSFRRKRRTSVTSSEGGGYTMKRSMRGQAQSAAGRPTSPPASPTNRFSLRARSPPSQKPGRSSMRGSADPTTPTLRANGFKGSDQRSSKTGFGRSSKPSKAGPKLGSRFKSRFNDSSDEEGDDQPRFASFRSRYDDSDDEDDAGGTAASPRKLAPVRGIPRKPGQASGDSTELEDSDDGGAFVPDEAAMAAARRKIAAESGTTVPSTPPNANGAAEGKALHAGTLRGDASVANSPSSPTQGKAKRGFFAFGKKKPAAGTSQPSSPLASNASPRAGNPTATSPGGGSKLLRRLSSSGSIPKAAATETSSPAAAPPIPPIPDSYKEYSTAGLGRPNTSDGASAGKMPTTMRPALGNKRESAMTAPLAGEQPTIYSERTGRKKKFQGLRRFLGVRD